MNERTTARTPLLYSRIAGVAYLVIILLSAPTVALVDTNLIVADDHAATAQNIVANDLLFRTSVAVILLMYATVVVLAWALYVLLKTVDERLALLATLFRTAEAVIGAATVMLGLVVMAVLTTDPQSPQLGAESVHALVGIVLDARTASLDVVLVFVGLGGTIFCYLFYAARYVPRILAAWGIFTYASMLLLALVSILFPNHPAMLENVLYASGGLFELAFGFWLLIKGVNLEQWKRYTTAADSIA